MELLFNFKKTSFVIIGLLVSQLSFAGFYMGDAPAEKSVKIKKQAIKTQAVDIGDSEDDMSAPVKKTTSHSKNDWKKIVKDNQESEVKPEPVKPVQKKLINFSIEENDNYISVAASRWCAESGGECRMLKWKSEWDSPLEAGATFSAENAKDAIRQLLANIAKTTGHAFDLDTHYQNNVWIVTDKAN
jgi:hypothetical protein